MPQEDSSYSGKVEVFGDNVFAEPLLSSSEAKLIVIRKRNGEPMALFARLKEDAWAFAHEGEKDWAEAKARFGV